MSDRQQTCAQCGKEITSDSRVGSLTSFLLDDLSCSCRAAAISASKEPSKLCGRCNKIIPEFSKSGSITSFFFRDIRCQCREPLRASLSKNPADKALRTRYSNSKLTQVRQNNRATAIAKTKMAFASDAAAFVDLSPGQVIGGSYKLIALAGQGGMGSVYKAKHIGLSRQCAIKFIAPSLVSEETWRQFQKEAKLISSLTHNTICQIYDLGIHERMLPYYAMDYIEGITLDEYITRFGPLSVGATAELYIKVLDGLTYAHRRGIVHKDLKPANIMLEKQSDGEVQVRILDFGISELNEPGSRRGSRGEVTIVGSAAYMSPEQFRGRVLEKVSDLYSLGCSMYETLTGNLPYEGDGFDALQKAHTTKICPRLYDKTGCQFPDEIEAIVAKCMRKNPQERYQSASELTLDLQRLIEGKPLQFAQSGESEAKKRAKATGGQSQNVGAAEARRQKQFEFPIAAVSLVFVLLIVVACGYFVWQFNPQQEPDKHVVPRAKAVALTEGKEPPVLEDKFDIDGVANGAFSSPYSIVDRTTDYSLIVITNSVNEAYKVPPSEGLLYSPNSSKEMYENLPGIRKDKLVGMDLTRITNPSQELHDLLTMTPNIECLIVPKPNDEMLKNTLLFKKLKHLEVHNGYGWAERFPVSKSIDSLIFQSYSTPVFVVEDGRDPDAKIKCKKLLFRFSTVNKAGIQSIVRTIDVPAVTFTNCAFEKDSLMGFAGLKKPMQVCIISDKTNIPKFSAQEIASLKANKVNITWQVTDVLKKNDMK